MKKNNVTRCMFLFVAVFMLTLPVQALAGKVHKLGLSLAITGPTSDAGNPYAKGVEDTLNFGIVLRSWGMIQSNARSGTINTITI